MNPLIPQFRANLRWQFVMFWLLNIPKRPRKQVRRELKILVRWKEAMKFSVSRLFLALAMLLGQCYLSSFLEFEFLFSLHLSMSF
jgi:hypothetical protein